MMVLLLIFHYLFRYIDMKFKSKTVGLGEPVEWLLRPSNLKMLRLFPLGIFVVVYRKQLSDNSRTTCDVASYRNLYFAHFF